MDNVWFVEGDQTFSRRFLCKEIVFCGWRSAIGVAVNFDRGVVYVLRWYILVMCCSMVEYNLKFTTSQYVQSGGSE